MSASTTTIHRSPGGPFSLASMLSTPMLVALATGAAAVAASTTQCMADCRPGGFDEPLLYFSWTNTTAASCCALCAANATCAFAIRRAHDGTCWPSPASAHGFEDHKPGITTCRTPAAPAWPVPPPDLLTWPMVRGDTTAGDTFGVAAPGFVVRCDNSSGGCPTAEVLAWYQQRIRADSSPRRWRSTLGQSKPALVVQVLVEVRSPLRALSPLMNESYGLHCNTETGGAAGCTVRAVEAVGALRGLETLAHLTHASAVPLPLALAADNPRFPYRGLLLDSARHFLPVATVRRVLDGMSATKLNVLHWHLTDDTSFPVQSAEYPQLSARGAFHPGLVYTPTDLRAVVAHATARGVRVVPEFDIPGHSSFGKGMPEITIADCGGVLDPTLDATYAFLRRYVRRGLVGGMMAQGGDGVDRGGRGSRIRAREDDAYPMLSSLPL